MKQKYNGFTLIELMVSVALMLIIIGMTMVIFNSTSTTFTVAEAKVDIMQNARLALDTIAKDIANATEISGKNLFDDPVVNPNLPDNNNHCLQITTVTNWINGESKVTNKARVAYRLQQVRQIDGERLYQLHRIIYPHDNNNPGHYQDLIDDSILAEFLVDPLNPNLQLNSDNISHALYFEFFTHPGTINNTWVSRGNLLINQNQDLPPLVRVTITVTDEFRTACRTLSRMIWIPKGIRRQ